MYSTMALDARGFWTEQLPLCKLYALYLGCVVIYSLLSLSGILVRLGSLNKQETGEDFDHRYRVLGLLRNKSDNLFQLTCFSALLFGVVFFLQINANFVSLDDSSLTGWAFIGHSLTIYFEFAACVFLVLLILHAAELIVSAHLRRLTLPH